MFKDTTDIDKDHLREVREIDTLRQIEGIAKQIQRKAQAMGAVGKKRWVRESESLQFLQREIDNIYGAAGRVLKEFHRG